MSKRVVMIVVAGLSFAWTGLSHTAAADPKAAPRNGGAPLVAAADPLAPWLHGVTFHAVSEQPQRHSMHSYYVTSPESPDGKWVVFYTSTSPTRQEDGEIHIRNRATGEEKALARH